jgi:methylated-DNA-[protein]-cysteine S-methyltransferase
MTTTHTIIETQMGDLTLVAADGVLTGVYYPGHWTRPDRTLFGPRAEEGFEETERRSTSRRRPWGTRSSSACGRC